MIYLTMCTKIEAKVTELLWRVSQDRYWLKSARSRQITTISLCETQYKFAIINSNVLYCCIHYQTFTEVRFMKAIPTFFGRPRKPHKRQFELPKNGCQISISLIVWMNTNWTKFFYGTVPHGWLPPFLFLHAQCITFSTRFQFLLCW